MPGSSAAWPRRRATAAAARCRWCRAPAPLVDALDALGARRIAVIAPYVKALTGMVCDYIGVSGPEVVRSVNLEVDDNLELGRLDSDRLAKIAGELDTSDVDALVLSACVQMPSLPGDPAGRGPPRAARGVLGDRDDLLAAARARPAAGGPRRPQPPLRPTVHGPPGSHAVVGEPRWVSRARAHRLRCRIGPRGSVNGAERARRAV
jgi:hypothetical protein